MFALLFSLLSPATADDSAIIWLERYAVCLDANVSQLNDKGLATRTVLERAATRCEPVRASAKKMIVAHLGVGDAPIEVNDRNKLADRLLDIVMRDTSARAGRGSA